MADENVSKLVAKWLANNPQLEGMQGSFSPSVNGVPNNISTAKKITTSKGVIPFRVSMQDGDGNTIGGTLQLLINPSDLNYGSTQMQSSSYGRDSHIVTLWGPSQGTLTGNGSSAAFFTERGGLASASPINPRKDTLAFANLMSFIAMIRHNGYYSVMPKPEVTPDIRKEGKGDTSGTVEEKDVTSSGENESSTQRGLTPSHLNLLTGVDKNRVVHVMDNVLVSYDGTGYLGSFQAFTLENSADSPFKFNYSFEFIISGLVGDKISGHIHTGNNKNRGVRIGKQGTSFVYTLGIDKEGVLDTIKRLPRQEITSTVSGSVGGYIESFISKGMLAVKPDKPEVNYNGLRTEISSAIPIIYSVYQESAEMAQEMGYDTKEWFPPLLTSALEGGHVKGSKHYKGLAMDIRINRVFPKFLREKISKDLAESLNGTIWVLWHPKGKDTEHIHLEYDPEKSSRYNGKPGAG